MGNKVLGKRSRNFYNGFNERQLTYIKQKFSTMTNGKDAFLDKDKFMQSYKLNEEICKAFYKLADFDQSTQIQEYEFICAVNSFCSMTIEELGSAFLNALAKPNAKGIKQQQLKNFTDMCIKYNSYLQNNPIKEQQLQKKNSQKFKKYDADKSKFIERQQFISILCKDEDYKKWLFNMGFLTKNQLSFADQIYDLVDSDLQEQIRKHLSTPNPNIDKIKRGIEHRIGDDDFAVDQEIGDQALPSQIHQKLPWQQEIKTAKDIDDKRYNPNTPSQSLTIDHIFGYRGYDCRNNVKFDSKGNIVYHQGVVGIVINQKTKKQNYLNQHQDDITCLEIIEDLVATGELGSRPSVILWKTQNSGKALESQLIISKNLKDSVANMTMTFATEEKSKKPGKRLLAVSCNDPDHTLVIYDIEQLMEIRKDLTSKKTGIVATGPISKMAIFDLKFTPDTKLVMAATLKEMLFIKYEKSVLIADRGQFNDFSNSPALCLTALSTKTKKYMLSGMANGSIYFWEENKCVKAVSGHSGSVSALESRKDIDSFISGDKSGKIIVWSDKFQKENVYSISQTNSPSNMIISLSTNRNSELLIGTRASNIYKINFKNNKNQKISNQSIIQSGHSNGHIYGLTIDQSQTNKIFYTGGQDQRLIKWSYGEEYKLLKEIKCPYSIRSIDHNHYSKTILVGYENGVVEIFDENMQKKASFNKIKTPDQQALNIVKFAKIKTNEKGNEKVDEKVKKFAVCYSYPKFMVKIFEYNQNSIIQSAEISDKFNSKITSMDFGRDQNESLYLRLNTEDLHFFLYQISGKKPTLIQDLSKVSDRTTFMTHSTVLSSETQGFKTQGVLESDIICCQRSRKYRNVFAIGDKYSKIKLFNFPCKKFPFFNKYSGHSNEVTAIQFDPREQYMISIGGQQKSIIVWKYDPDESKNEHFFNQVEEYEVPRGEQTPSIQAWKGQIKQPSNFLQKYNVKKDNKLPDYNLEIQHVFGLRNEYLTDEVRNQCKYSKDLNHILFPTACLGVKMDIESKKQEFFLQHKQDIVSFAIDDKRQLMATGQMAEKNTEDPLKKLLTIVVWDIENKKVLKKLNGFHTIAIVLLSFSPNSKLLFSVGNDSKNTYAIYDWKSGAILNSGPVSGGKVNGIAWKSDLEFFTCGNDHVKVWEKGKGKMKAIDGKFVPMFSCAVSKNTYITGGGDGCLYNFTGSKSEPPIKAHNGKVQTIVVVDDLIFTGGDDGVIFQWKANASGQITKDNCQKIYDTRNAFPKERPSQEEEYGILSIDFDDFSKKPNRMLIATKGTSVIELNFSKSKSKLIHQGHYKGQLWGLAAQFQQDQQDYIITGGDDRSVRCWDISNKKEEVRVDLGNKVRGLDISKDGRIVVADVKCKIYLYDEKLRKSLITHQSQLFKVNSSNKTSKKQPFVEDIKFSPDGKKIVFGCHEKADYLEILTIQNNKMSGKKVPAGSSALLHVDWAKDSQRFSINTQAYQLLFYGSEGTKEAASSSKDEEWATWTRKLGWQSKGIYQSNDLTDINTVCRSPDSQLMAVGYDDQKIRLFKYPCYIPKQVSKEYYGHSSHVTRIKFNSSSSRMYSIGGLDRTIIVWKVKSTKQHSETREELQMRQDDSDGIDDIDEDVELPKKVVTRKPKKQSVEDFYNVAEEGDEFMAVKPWVGAIREPTYKYPVQKINEAPKVRIELEYVFGYRSKDCRQNIFYKKSGTILFYAAAALIEHNIKSNTQIICTDHNDDILSLDYNKDKQMILTGQLGPKPLLNLYQKGKLIHTFLAPVKKGIISASISPSGLYGVCVGIDDDHEVTVLDLKKGSIISTQKGSKKIITKVKWVSDDAFVTIGIRHYKYWKRSQLKKPSEGKIAKGQDSNKGLNYVSIDADDSGLILTGSNHGVLRRWSESNGKAIQIQKQLLEKDLIKREFKVIQVIKIMKNFVALGTRSGYIVFLKKDDLKIITVIDIGYECNQGKLKLVYHLRPPLTCCIRAIDFCDNKMIVGTLSSEIYEFDFNETKMEVSNSKNILKCHNAPNISWTNEVWGLCISTNYAFTCSDDATIRVWSIKDKELVYCHQLIEQIPQQESKNDLLEKAKQIPEQAKARALAVSPNEKYVAVGSKDGTVRIFSLSVSGGVSLDQIKIITDAKQQISDIKFAFETLIVGSHDNGIYVYDFDYQSKSPSLKRKYKPLKKHSSYITHIDVSRDNCFMQSTCGAYELLYWDINSGKQITGGATLLRNELWKTWTCNLGWPVQGIYPKCEDGTFINAVDRSNLTKNNNNIKSDTESFSLLAVGNDNGKVCLYNYPSVLKNTKFVEGKGHSSHVTNVRWNEDDTRIISTGGQDQCVMIWKVSK